jgi:hypothetical protein
VIHEVVNGSQYARPEELANLHEAGVETKKFPGSMGHQLRYPAPELIRPRLNEMIAELKTNLAKPDADPVGAAAQFLRSPGRRSRTNRRTSRSPSTGSRSTSVRTASCTTRWVGRTWCRTTS